MRIRNGVALIVALAVSVMAGCGKKESAPPAGQPSSSAPAPNAPGAVAGLAEMAKGIEQMGKAAQEMQSQKPVDPVDFKQLVSLLPEVPGWQKGDPEGERMTNPVSYAQAKCAYTKGDATIDAEITDSGFNQMLVAPMMMMMTGFSKESTTGYERGTNVGGNPAFEKWNSRDKDGEITILINKRFIYTLKGRGLDDPKVLHDVAEKTDLKKLASMH